MCGWVDVIRERECVCVCVIREYVVRDRLSVRVGVLIGCVDKMCYWGRGVVDPPASVAPVGMTRNRVSAAEYSSPGTHNKTMMMMMMMRTTWNV